MAQVIISESYLTDIANAIRSKTGTSITYKPSEMSAGIRSISGGGITPTGTISITENGTYDVTQYAGASVAVPTSGVQINNQDKTVNPSTSQQQITYDSAQGYTGLGTVTVTAMPTMTLPTSAAASATSGYSSKATIGRSTSNQYINIPPGYNAAGEYYLISAVPNGTAGTPTASKGTVSNHSVSITPSVTNTTGYITGSTKTGTAVSVSASELVSGNKEITSNGTNIDVANYSTVSVAVPTGGGSSMNVQAYIGRASRNATTYGATAVSLTVAVTGTYTVSWSAWRSSSSGTMGTNLHVNSTTGTNQQTFTNTYGQQIQLTNQHYNAGDVLTIYATSGSTSRYINVANLIIQQTA